MPAKADLVQKLADNGWSLPRRAAARLQRQRYVSGSRAPRQQRLAVILKDDRDGAIRSAKNRSVEFDCAHRRSCKARQHPEQGRLAAARRPDDGNGFTRCDIDADTANDLQRAIGECDVANADARLLVALAGSLHVSGFQEIVRDSHIRLLSKERHAGQRSCPWCNQRRSSARNWACWDAPRNGRGNREQREGRTPSPAEAPVLPPPLS